MPVSYVSKFCCHKNIKQRFARERRTVYTAQACLACCPRLLLQQDFQRHLNHDHRPILHSLHPPSAQPRFPRYETSQTPSPPEAAQGRSRSARFRAAPPPVARHDHASPLRVFPAVDWPVQAPPPRGHETRGRCRAAWRCYHQQHRWERGLSESALAGSKRPACGRRWRGQQQSLRRSATVRRAGCQKRIHVPDIIRRGICRMLLQ